MKIRRPSDDEGGVEVSMSPLIDCVFLLLIFFLVTTMIKRKERRIPIRQPDSVLGLSSVKVSDTNYIGITKEGKFKRPMDQQIQGDGVKYVDIPDLEIYLRELASKGMASKPLVIQVNRDVEFQDALKVFDLCTIQGFKNVTTSLDTDNFQAKFKKEKDEN